MYDLVNLRDAWTFCLAQEGISCRKVSRVVVVALNAMGRDVCNSNTARTHATLFKKTSCGKFNELRTVQRVIFNQSNAVVGSMPMVMLSPSKIVLARSASLISGCRLPRPTTKSLKPAGQDSRYIRSN